MKKLIFAPVAPKPAHVERSSRPVATFVLALKTFLLVERLPHRRPGRAGPGDEQQVGVRLLRLLRERREVVRRQRDEDLRDAMPLAAHDRGDSGHVALPERRVLREDDDLPPDSLAEQRLRREHVLPALAAGAERVLVDARHGVGRGRAGDEQHLVLRGDRRDWSATPDEVEPARIL